MTKASCNNWKNSKPPYLTTVMRSKQPPPV